MSGVRFECDIDALGRDFRVEDDDRCEWSVRLIAEIN